jgi:calcineurin-like phosphoesterase family protein
MNEAMIKEWNEIVEPEDTVYILGDVAFMPASKAVNILRRLNGRKILIEGNHDRKALKDPMFARCFDEVHKYLEIVHNGTKVCMFHYPIAEFNQQHRGAVHFHGHLHGNPSGIEEYRVLDVGMDSTGWIVLEMDDAVRRALKGEIKGHH